MLIPDCEDFLGSTTPEVKSNLLSEQAFNF